MRVRASVLQMHKSMRSRSRSVTPGDMLSQKLIDDEEPADYVRMLLRYWLKRDKKLPEQYRSAEKLREAIVAQVCD